MLDVRTPILAMGAFAGVGIGITTALAMMRRSCAAQYAEVDVKIEADRPSVTPSFVCSICLETVSDEEVFEQESCSHKVCRDCGRNYVLHEVDARRIPVQCCVCTAEKAEPPCGIIAEREVFLVLEPEEQERYLRFALDASFMSQAKNLSKCPSLLNAILSVICCYIYLKKVEMGRAELLFWSPSQKVCSPQHLLIIAAIGLVRSTCCCHGRAHSTIFIAISLASASVITYLQPIGRISSGDCYLRQK